VIEVRRRETSREPCDLDERAVGAKGDSVVTANAEVEVGPQRAVSGLLTAVHADVSAAPPHRVRRQTSDAAVGAGKQAVGTRPHRVRLRAAEAVRPFGAHVSANLYADIGTGDVVESRTVQGADLHVFDRLGLYGKIGGLCSRNRNDTYCGNEEKIFHHLHCCSSVFT
jgi:hypothetical protein